MLGTVAVVATFVLLVGQIPMAIFVYFDAKRRGVEYSTRTQYEFGIIAPMLGFIIFFHYLANRDELPRSDRGK